MGSGAFGVAAVRAKRSSAGNDVSNEACELARRLVLRDLGFARNPVDRPLVLSIEDCWAMRGLLNGSGKGFSFWEKEDRAQS